MKSKISKRNQIFNKNRNRQRNNEKQTKQTAKEKKRKKNMYKVGLGLGSWPRCLRTPAVGIKFHVVWSRNACSLVGLFKLRQSKTVENRQIFVNKTELRFGLCVLIYENSVISLLTLLIFSFLFFVIFYLGKWNLNTFFWFLI